MSNNEKISPIFDKLNKKLQAELHQTEQEQAIAYFSRHGRKDGLFSKVFLLNGLTLVRNKDGMWLDFGADGEPQAMVHFDMMGPQGHPGSPVQMAIDAWCKNFAEKDDAS